MDTNGTTRRRTPATIVVMGVSGSGKSTLGRHLATALGWAFLEGDALHPPANIAKMATGTPLEGADRWPWLDAIAAWMRDRRAAGHDAVVACSALRRTYRDRLRQAVPGLRLVYLEVARDELARRMRDRRHFMPPSLLDSQLATLEAPAPDESALHVVAHGPVEDTLARTLRGLERQGVLDHGTRGGND